MAKFTIETDNPDYAALLAQVLRLLDGETMDNAEYCETVVQVLFRLLFRWSDPVESTASQWQHIKPQIIPTIQFIEQNINPGGGEHG